MGRLCVILNPRSGGGRAKRVLKGVAPVFAEAGLELDVRATRCPGHARELVRGLDADFDGVCVLGGDGTLHEVVNGLMVREDPAALPLGVVPAGSGNSLAWDLGLTDPVRAARAVAAGATGAMDVMVVKSAGAPLYAFNIVGWGGAVDAGRWAERMRWLGPGRYGLANALVVARRRLRSARVTLDGDGESWSGRFLFVLACNTQHTGRGLRMAPGARLDDGLIDLIALTAAGRFEVAALLRSIADGGHLDSPHVRHARVARFSLAPGAPDPLNVDGEITSRAPMEVSVLPGALRVFGLG